MSTTRSPRPALLTASPPAATHSPAPPLLLKVDAYVIKSSELNFKPVTDPMGKIKTGTVGPWACERHECTGDMQLQTFRKGAGDNLLEGLSMKVCVRLVRVLV